MHVIAALRQALADGTPGQGWSEQGYLRIVGLGLGIAILIVAFRYLFGKK
jgi:hypothetical protein